MGHTGGMDSNLASDQDKLGLSGPLGPGRSPASEGDDLYYCPRSQSHTSHTFNTYPTVPEGQLHGIGMLRHQGAAQALTLASLGT